MKNLVIFFVIIFFGTLMSHAQTLTADTLQDSGNSKDWSIGGGGAGGNNLEIREPEQGNQLWVNFNDFTQTVEFADGMPNISLQGSIFGSRTGSASPQFSIHAATNSSDGSSLEMFGDNHTSPSRPAYHFVECR